MKLFIRISVLVLVVSTFNANAQNIKPGLWEVKSNMQGSSSEMSDAMAQAQKQMESMPPEQRKMVQDMMAKQGVQMGASDGGMTLKICMTKEMVDGNEMAAYQGANENNCTYSNFPRVGNTLKFAFVCSNPASKGEGQVTYNSSEAYSMKLSTMTTVNGKPEKMQMQNSGRWLGKDCGTVKPIVLPKK